MHVNIECEWLILFRSCQFKGRMLFISGMKEKRSNLQLFCIYTLMSSFQSIPDMFLSIYIYIWTLKRDAWIWLVLSDHVCKIRSSHSLLLLYGILQLCWIMDGKLGCLLGLHVLCIFMYSFICDSFSSLNHRHIVK